MKWVSLVLSLVLITNNGVLSYPSGAPTGACKEQFPHHSGSSPQDTRSPFTISTSTTTISSGNKIKLRLDSPQGVAFAGFMLQARPTDGQSQPIGTFTSLPELARSINCNTEQDTATHKDKTKKKSLEFEWEPPTDFEGSVVFNATFVQDYSTFWTGVPSENVRVVRSSAVNNSSGAGISTTRSPLRTTRPTYTIPPQRATDGPSTGLYDGCSVSRNCFGIPSGCESSRSCNVLVMVTVSGDVYMFELVGAGYGVEGGYVAVGLSSDDKMDEDSVAECVVEGGNVRLHGSYNRGYSNIREPDSSSSLYLRSDTQMITDSNLYCKFTRTAKSTVSGNNYDLDTTAFYLLLAAGQGATPTGVSRHDNRLATSKAIKLSDVQTIAAAKNVLSKLHGCFMVAAWVGFASTGIILARYFKKTWVNSQLCGTAQWFYWHRACMISTWVLTIAGFIIIFVDVGGWYGATNNPHAVLGCITTALVFIQPIAAAFRPAPGTKYRPLFYWTHWAVGNAALILAVITMFYAVRLTKAELPRWVDWILTGLVVSYACIHLIFSFFACLSDRKEEKKVNNIALKDMNSSRSPLHTQDTKRDSPSSCLRKFLLSLHLIIVIGITVALIVVIILAPIEENEVVLSTLKSVGLIKSK